MKRVGIRATSQTVKVSYMDNFIKCTDKETTEKLIKLGFRVINKSGNVTTFLNDTSKPVTFDEKKVVFTNKVEM